MLPHPSGHDIPDISENSSFGLALQSTISYKTSSSQTKPGPDSGVVLNINRKSKVRLQGRGGFGVARFLVGGFLAKRYLLFCKIVGCRNGGWAVGWERLRTPPISWGGKWGMVSKVVSGTLNFPPVCHIGFFGG